MWPIARDAAHLGSRRLLHLLIAIAMLSALAAALLPRALAWAAESKRDACASNRAAIRLTVERWYFLKGDWPDRKLADIGRDPDYFPNGVPRCPADGSSYEIHPVLHTIVGHSH